MLILVLVHQRPRRLLPKQIHKNITLYAVYGDIKTVISNFTFSNETYTLTAGGYSIHRSDDNLFMVGSYDLTEMDFVEFNFYVPVGGDVSRFMNMDIQLEIASSGTHDEDELNWHTYNYITISTIIPGEWSHIIIPFSEADELGAPNLSSINYAGLYWNNSTINPGVTYTIPGCQIKNFKFSNYPEYY